MWSQNFGSSNFGSQFLPPKLRFPNSCAQLIGSRISGPNFRSSKYRVPNFRSPNFGPFRLSFFGPKFRASKFRVLKSRSRILVPKMFGHQIRVSNFLSHNPVSPNFNPNSEFPKFWRWRRLHVQTPFRNACRARHTLQSRPSTPSRHAHCPVTLWHNALRLPCGWHAHSSQWPPGADGLPK